MTVLERYFKWPNRTFFVCGNNTLSLIEIECAMHMNFEREADYFSPQ